MWLFQPPMWWSQSCQSPHLPMYWDIQVTIWSHHADPVVPGPPLPPAEVAHWRHALNIDWGLFHVVVPVM